MAASSSTPLTPTPASTAVVAAPSEATTPLPSQTSASGSTAITPSTPHAQSDWTTLYHIVEVAAAVSTIVLAVDVILTWREKMKKRSR